MRSVHDHNEQTPKNENPIQVSCAKLISRCSRSRKRRSPSPTGGGEGGGGGGGGGGRRMDTAWIFRASLLSRKAILYLLVAMLPSTVKGGETTYYASNCYEVGGGNMGPLYLKCAGCQYVEAFECLDTLRTNASNNVPTGCGIDKLTVQPDPACCPIFADPSNQGSVDGSTSGYPDTLLCLENAGCAGDNLHTAIVAECKFNQCSDEFACAAVFSSSLRLAPAVGGIALAWLGLSIATAGFGWVGWR